MTRSPVAFISRVMRSHVGHVLLAVSWTFILLVYVRTHLTRPQFVECAPTQDEFVVIVDKFYPIWTTAIAVAHLPAMALTVGTTKLLQQTFSLSCELTAKIEIPLLFAFSAIQWLWLGIPLNRLFAGCAFVANTHPTNRWTRAAGACFAI